MTTSTYVKAFAIGAVAGSRSMTAPAATLLALDNGFAELAVIAAAGELLADKLPIAPPRTMPAAMAFRLISGGFCGRLIAKRAQESELLGMALGAAGAATLTQLGYKARIFATEGLGWSDWPLAVIEDAFAIVIAKAATAV